MAAAAPVLATTLQQLQQTHQQQQELAAASDQPGSNSSSSRPQVLLNSTTTLSRALQDLLHSSVAITAAVPSAAAAAQGLREANDLTIMLRDARLAAAVAPIAQLALALLQTPVDSSSSSSSSSERRPSSCGVSSGDVDKRTVESRRLELSSIIMLAAQLANAVAFFSPPLSTKQPAEISQLLMVNLAYTLQLNTVARQARTGGSGGSGGSSSSNSQNTHRSSC
jgi:hypothetical protein